MKTKTPIKIIKRDERNRQQRQATDDVKAERKSPQETARDMVATVSQWVNEFQQKRRTETAQAFKTLLGETSPHPGKA